MSYELVEDVLNHAPPMTAAERLLLVSIAERTRVRHQPWSIDSTVLYRYTGLSPRGFRDVLQRLAERGLDVRVPLGTGKNGSPYYAVPGVSPRYRLPMLEPPANCPCDRCTRNAPVNEGGTTVPPQASSENSTKGGTPVPGKSGDSHRSHRSRDSEIGRHSGAARRHPDVTQAAPERRQPDAAVPPKPSVPKPEGGSGSARAGALASAPPEDQVRAGNGTSDSPATRRGVTADELRAMLLRPLPSKDVAQGEDKTLSADDAKALIRAQLAGKPAAKLSRWQPQRDAAPNPHFKPPTFVDDQDGGDET